MSKIDRYEEIRKITKEQRQKIYKFAIKRSREMTEEGLKRNKEFTEIEQQTTNNKESDGIK